MSDSGGPTAERGRKRRNVWRTLVEVIGVVAAVVGLLLGIGVIKPFGDGDDDADLAVVPNVDGLEPDRAVSDLDEAGFDVQVEEVVSSTVAAGHVVSTAPTGGSTARTGSTVRVFVSTAANGGGAGDGGGGDGDGSDELVTIPDLEGTAVGDAIGALEALQLVVTTREEESDDVAVDLVIGTDPVAGEEVRHGDAIVLRVSTGPPEPRIDVALALDESCSIVPGGGLNGGDVMTVLFRATSVGELDYDGTVAVVARSDTGLEGHVTTRVSDSSASSFLQVEFAGQDYGRTHTFDVVAEPTSGGEESDDSNNGGQIVVRLPETRPSSTFDPCA